MRYRRAVGATAERAVLSKVRGRLRAIIVGSGPQVPYKGRIEIGNGVEKYKVRVWVAVSMDWTCSMTTVRVRHES